MAESLVQIELNSQAVANAADAINHPELSASKPRESAVELRLSAAKLSDMQQLSCTLSLAIVSLVELNLHMSFSHDGSRGCSATVVDLVEGVSQPLVHSRRYLRNFTLRNADPGSSRKI